MDKLMKTASMFFHPNSTLDGAGKETDHARQMMSRMTSADLSQGRDGVPPCLTRIGATASAGVCGFQENAPQQPHRTAVT
jgi:hypothetical protein